MSDPSYTIKEILELQFKNLNTELSAIRETLKEQNRNTNSQFIRHDTELEKLKTDLGEIREENAKYKTVWGIGATIGASLVAIVANRIF